MDITRLRSDLHVNTQTLSQLSERVDELERRQTDVDRTTRQTQQELSQAVEVLLRKALMAENQQTAHESGQNPSRVADHLESQPRPLPTVPRDVSTPGSNAQQGRKSLSLGMTQDDVRRMLGEPMSIEHVGSYVFWHYSWLSNQQYVIFEQVGGQVSGWRGL
jgi:hypothetical protein